jgi:hypothetical protein
MLQRASPLANARLNAARTIGNRSETHAALSPISAASSPWSSVRFWPRLCKNVFQRDRYSKMDWKLRFYARSTSADVPINFRFNIDAHTSILATRFYTLWAVCCLSPWQLLVDSCLFSTEGMIDNVRIQEVYHSYAALNYLQTDNVADI